MRIISDSVQDTLRLGRRIARRLHRGDIICLFGNLGSGKTVLVKGIARGLGVKNEAVTSPSFVLIRQHRGTSLPLYHFDFYRLKGYCDILSLGYEDYLYADAISVIEWPERLHYLLPREYLKIDLSIISDSKRMVKLSGVGSRYKKLVNELNESR